MKRLTRRRKPLWVLCISVILIMALTITSFASSSKNTDSDTEPVDGYYTFTGNGDWYGYTSYLDWNYDGPYISGREYEVTLPEDGRLEVNLTTEDPNVYIDVSIMEEGDRTVTGDPAWQFGSPDKRINITKKTRMLKKGTYSVLFSYNNDSARSEVLLAWPPGYHEFYHKLTFVALSADEQAAFNVEKNIDDLIKSDNSGRDGKVDEVKAAFDSLTDAQKNHIDQSKRDELVSIANIISDLRKDKAQAEADAKAKAEAEKAKQEAEAKAKTEAEKTNQKQEAQNQSQSNQNTNLKVKSLWASQHGVGKVKFKWTKKDNVTVTGWNLKYRMRKIGGKNKWSSWTNESYPAATYDVWIDIPRDYVIEIHAQAQGDTTWSTGIITTPAGGKYQAMKTAHVINTATGKRLTEKKVGNSAIYHTAINLKVGQTISVKPDYDYPVQNFKKRPRLYPNHMLYDIGNKSMITITKPDGSKYTGGIIEGTAKIKATKAGKTTIIFRSPNGRTMIADVTIR